MNALRRYAFDTETNGLLESLTKLHCLVIKNVDTGEVWDFADQPGKMPIQAGLEILASADVLIGHNIINFDLKAIKKVYPEWRTTALIRDTLVLTRLMWPHIAEQDFIRARKNKLPKKLIGSHSLEAWGWRIGNYKGDYSGSWDEWNPDMHEYMLQDGEVTFTLWKRIEKEALVWGVPLTDPNPPPGKDCIELEHRVAQIVDMVVDHGFRFDEAAAAKLHAKIMGRKLKVEEELQHVFPPETVVSVFIPKVNNKTRGYVKGVPIERKTVVPFQPSSRQQVAARLQKLGWKPEAFGANGVPTVDDDILTALPYPEAKLLAEYYMLEKRVGQIANGRAAWLKKVRKGRIHGRIASGGAHTGRMTHMDPNLAQVPGNHAPYGPECRDLFIADEGKKQVGCDADALELRDLAGYMATWDEGAYINTVLKGDKSNGTDMHTLNAKAIGCSRDAAKVFFYAMIYGAGDQKLGETLGFSGRRAAMEGKKARENLMKGVPALGSLVAAVRSRVEKRGYLIGLDGRRLTVRSPNAALNTLLQSAGAVQMKRGLVILFDRLIEAGWKWGADFAIVGLIHDEWQASVLPEKAEKYGELAAQSIRDAGTFYSFGCPLDGQYQIGQTWKDTH